ncbi:MAG TPA: hypothetical protein VHL13_06435, partial [Pseudolabrys sp.]|nr:hypothetical protein [Pseudolabrys sp.]
MRAGKALEIEHAVHLHKNTRRSRGLRHGQALLDFSTIRNNAALGDRRSGTQGRQEGLVTMSGEAGDIPGLDPALDR